jgi:hypothetical protein
MVERMATSNAKTTTSGTVMAGPSKLNVTAHDAMVLHTRTCHSFRNQRLAQQRATTITLTHSRRTHTTKSLRHRRTDSHTLTAQPRHEHTLSHPPPTQRRSFHWNTQRSLPPVVIRFCSLGVKRAFVTCDEWPSNDTNAAPTSATG